MGTRHLICIVVDGKFATAQYGQWDGYPSGQGQEIVSWLKEHYPEDLDRLKLHARNVIVLTPEVMRRRWDSCGADGSGMVGMDVVNKFDAQWPHLRREHGSKVLNYFLNTDKPEVSEQNPGFAADSLFCEWAYVLDLDTEELEVYEGFQRAPHDEGRFHDLPYTPPEHRQNEEQEYWPVKLVAKWKMGAIPDDWQSVVRPPACEVCEVTGEDLNEGLCAKCDKEEVA